jgi:hypothetical protein
MLLLFPLFVDPPCLSGRPDSNVPLDFRRQDADEVLSGKGFTASLRLKNAYSYQ